MNRLIAFSLILLFSCKTREATSSQISAAPLPAPKGSYQIEPYPANRLSIKTLEEDESLLFKDGEKLEIQKIQNFEGMDYGLRIIRNKEDLEKFIRPGDIMVYYSPLTSYSDPVLIAKQGMTHGAIVVSNKDDEGKEQLPGSRKIKLCHIDSPSSMSGCLFYGSIHFFRPISLTDEISKKINAMAYKLWADGYLYDEGYVTDIFNTPMEKLKKILDEKKCPPQYCSELPFTIWSVMTGKPFFKGQKFSETLDTFSLLKKKGKFAIDLSHKFVKASILVEFQRGISGENLKKVDQILDKFLNDKGISTVEKAFIDFAKGNLIPPNLYLARSLEAKDRAVVYLGSTETRRGQLDFLAGDFPPGTVVTSDLPSHAKWRVKLGIEGLRNLNLAKDETFLLGSLNRTLFVIDSGTGVLSATIPLPNEGTVKIENFTFHTDKTLILHASEIDQKQSAPFSTLENQYFYVDLDSAPPKVNLFDYQEYSETEKDLFSFLNKNFGLSNDRKIFALKDHILNSHKISSLETYGLGSFYGNTGGGSEAHIAAFGDLKVCRLEPKDNPQKWSCKASAEIIYENSPDYSYKGRMRLTEPILYRDGRAFSSFFNMEFIRSFDNKLLYSQKFSGSDFVSNHFRSIGFLGFLDQYFFIDNKEKKIKVLKLSDPIPQMRDFLTSTLPKDLIKMDDSIVFFPNLQLAASAKNEPDFYAYISVYRISTGEKLASLRAGKDSILELIVSKDGRFIYATDSGGNLYCFDWQRNLAVTAGEVQEEENTVELGSK